jgi:two-component system, OmpR family, KDP operon response regulator KdpE
MRWHEMEGRYMSDDQAVLVVDDDPHVLKLVRVNLAARGYRVREASNGVDALSLFRQEAFDLVILDLVMPGMGGIDVCLQIREQSDVPIIVLSAHNQEELKVQALDAGADDFVTKPFGQEELLARMRAVWRRAGPPAAAPATGKVMIGDLTVDLGARRVFVKGGDIRLTRTEFALLAELARNLEAVLTHDELLTRVWGPEFKGSSHYLHIYLGRIRSKLGPGLGSVLETVPGMGYVMHASP